MSFLGHSESFPILRPWFDYKVIQNYGFAPKKRPSRDPARAAHNLINSARQHSNGDREPMLSNSHRIQELLREDFSWMNRSHFVVHSEPPNGGP